MVQTVVQKVIIDADPGIGDGIAIALALSDPELDVVLVTATGGRFSGPVTTTNIHAVIEALDPPKWPRVGASAALAAHSSIDFRATPVSARDLNGENGLGDCLLRVAEMANVREAAKMMAETVRNAPDEITILTLGPLTNIDVACELDPGFLSRVKGLFCLGGSVECGGDVTAVAEFNIYADPQSARNVLRCPAPKTLIPLDVSRQTVLTFDLYDRLLDNVKTPLAEFLGQVLPFSLRAHRQFLGMEGVLLHEVTALCAIACPRLFHTESMAVDVETAGELTRGMTVFDRRETPHWQTNIDVVREIDTQGVLDYLSRIVRG